jgi:molecular chaperone DnaJ
MYSVLLRTFHKSLANLKSKDFYSILGVSKSSSDQEIKSSYFSLAKKYHPDLNKSKDSKEKFSEISIAYETLGDKEKRRIYDSTGMNADEQEAKSKGLDSDEIDEFVKNNQKREKGSDVKVSIELSFFDSLRGCEKTVSYEKLQTCSTCRGTRAKPGTFPEKCSQCGGFGIVLIEKAGEDVQVTCDKCSGLGKTVKNPCSSCKASGLATLKSSEKLKIPPGVENGSFLKVIAKGHASTSKGPEGDLQVKLFIQDHGTMKRKGCDLFSTVNLKPAQAVLGGLVEIETISGKVMLEVAPGLKNGETLRLSQYGVPHLPPSQLRGDHYINFQVKVPKKLSTTQQKLYASLFNNKD